MKDLYSNIKVVHAITPQAVGTTGIAGGKLSAVLDRQGYDSICFLYSSGASASVADTITPVVYECATTGGSFTSVGADDLNGTEAALTLTAAKSGKVGYRGNKRYLKIRLYGTGTATAVVAATMIGGNPENGPLS
jgi:hypothetical protein